MDTSIKHPTPLDALTLKRLLALRRASSSWIGARRPTRITTEEDGPLDACLWLNAASEQILAGSLVPSGQHPEAMTDLLVTAMLTPLVGKPSRPKTVALGSGVSTPGLARLLDDLGVKAVLSLDDDLVDEIVAGMESALHGEPAPGYLAPGDVRPEQVHELFQAAARLWELAPWEAIPCEVMVCLEDLADVPLFVSILGHQGEVFGLGIFLDPRSSLKVLAGTATPDDVDVIHLLFHEKGELPSAALAEVEANRWPLASASAVPIVASTASRMEGRLARPDELSLATLVVKSVLALDLSRAVQHHPLRIDGRTVHVTFPMALEAPPRKTAASKTGYHLRITLDGFDPPIDRLVEVPAWLTLHELHRVVQAAMGWGDDHLYRFVVDGTAYSEDDEPSDEVTLANLGLRARKKLQYVYDFGDDWRHTIRVEKSIKDAGIDVPRILEGTGACPPEDCGGLPGYLEILESLEDRRHPRREELREWLPRGFDPDRFDVKKANLRLSRLFPKPRRKQR